MTPDHALRIEGLLVQAGALVNGTTITLEAATRTVTAYHVETAAHDVILAEGVPSETFVDYAGLRAFDNVGEDVALHGETGTRAELALPRITCARMLPQALRARIGLAAAA